MMDALGIGLEIAGGLLTIIKDLTSNKITDAEALDRMDAVLAAHKHRDVQNRAGLAKRIADINAGRA